jgi:ABC-type amino acid transport substrate-binding protein
MKKLILFLLIFVTISAQQKITVGTKVAEPFVIKNPDGTWTGVSFDLWKDVSKNLAIEYNIKEFDLEGLVNAVENGNVDIAVSPLTITAGREQKFDFTHPYFITGLSIAVPAKEDGGFFSLAKRIISPQFFEAIGILALILFLVGLITWLFERKKNPEEFGDGRSKGLWSSFWFAAVTMTTVGYGDKSPRSVGGRIVALIWMFAAIIIISSITAAIASALTVGQLETNVQSLNDLYSANVATVGSSSAESFLIEKRINYTTNESVSDGLKSLANGDLEAFVYDAPIMKYLIKKEGLSSKVKVLHVTLEQVYYGFALPTNSPLREKLNRSIIDKISNPKWEDVLYKYFGE